ncbi:hypothetical protein [Cellulosimicrobium marinum]|uniref:hypothetical protein n=1 Tax=Cellulosimicrobium marinum TaxID=1638992 RepID=UPI001E459B66|nr:hypothetical protein [Cellulosimicrobium marinum]MCB7135783.1 hypothetical protein [Cellulosimicrobium marinum]
MNTTGPRPPAPSRPVPPSSPSSGFATTTRPLGLPFLGVAALSLLAAPRVVLHDLGVVQEGSAVNLLLVVVPLVAWVGVALWARVPNPFLTLLVTGACYGVVLALVHQLLWDRAFGEDPPSLGGNLALVDGGTQEVVLRVASVGSSLVTGVVVGAVCGLVAWGLTRLVRRRPARP